MNNFFLIMSIVTCVVFFGFKLKEVKFDVVSPGLGTLFLFIISMLFALFGNLSWNIKFEPRTFFVIFSAITVICIAEYAAKMINKKRLHIRNILISKDAEKNSSYREILRINIPSCKKMIVIILTILLTLFYTYSIASFGKESVSWIAVQGIKFVMASAYVNTFVFTNNILAEQKKRKDIILLIPFFCGIICSFFTGVRTEMLRLILALFVYMVIILQERNNWKKQLKSIRFIIKKSLIYVCLFLIAFFIMREYIKSADIGENLYYGFFMYLCFYIGSPWIVLNVKIARNLTPFKGNTWGQNSFSNIISDLVDLGIIKDNRIWQNSFISLDSQLHVNANADTIIASPLIDFGYVGMIIFIFITYFLVSYMYYRKIRYICSDKKRNIALIKYAFIYYIIGISFYSNGVNFIISLYYFLTYIIIRIIYWFYFKV